LDAACRPPQRFRLDIENVADRKIDRETRLMKAQAFGSIGQRGSLPTRFECRGVRDVQHVNPVDLTTSDGYGFMAAAGTNARVFRHRPFSRRRKE
jgi:hypothetical protein